MTSDKPIKVDLKADLTEGGNRVLTSAADAVDSSKGFLGKIFNEGADEFGLILKQEFRGWRMLRAIKLTQKIQDKFDKAGLPDNFTIHPRIGYEILHQGSLQEDEMLQEWWTGLFISSLAKSPSDEALVFLELKKSLSTSQAKMLKYFVESANVIHSIPEMLFSESRPVAIEEVIKAADTDNLLRLDRELDSLRYLGLIGGGFNIHSDPISCEIEITSLGLQFYARCNGVKDDLHIFYDSKEIEKCPRCGNRHRQSFLMPSK